MAIAAAAGWLAARCHSSGWAPIGLVSLAVGVGLGYGISKLATALGIDCRKHLIAGTLIFAAAAIFAEHAWLYQDFRRQWQDERTRNPQVAMFRSESPWRPAEYFRREATIGRIALWCLDATLVVTGAAIVVVIQRKKFVVADDAN